MRFFYTHYLQQVRETTQQFILFCDELSLVFSLIFHFLFSNNDRQTKVCFIKDVRAPY